MKYAPFNFPLALVVTLGLASCKGGLESQEEQKARENEQQIQQYIQANNLKPQKSPTGLYYQITPGGGTRRPQVGEQVIFTRVGRRLDGVIFDSTSVNPTRTTRANFGIGRFGFLGLEEGISLLTPGDSATLLIPFFLAFGSTSFSTLPAFSPVRYDVKLIAVRNETEQIDAYIQENNLTPTQRTTDGLVLVRTSAPTTGALPQAGQTARVTYIVKSLSGTEFDKGFDDFQVGSASRIKGYSEGIKLMRVGEKAQIIFPSALGYGTAGYQSIPGYTPLVFEIELISVK